MSIIWDLINSVKIRKFQWVLDANGRSIIIFKDFKLFLKELSIFQANLKLGIYIVVVEQIIEVRVKWSEYQDVYFWFSYYIVAKHYSFEGPAKLYSNKHLFYPVFIF